MTGEYTENDRGYKCVVCLSDKLEYIENSAKIR